MLGRFGSKRGIVQQYVTETSTAPRHDKTNPQNQVQQHVDCTSMSKAKERTKSAVLSSVVCVQILFDCRSPMTALHVRHTQLRMGEQWSQINGQTTSKLGQHLKQSSCTSKLKGPMEQLIRMEHMLESEPRTLGERPTGAPCICNLAYSNHARTNA